jgi:superfamily II DNA or RNA helicase
MRRLDTTRLQELHGMGACNAARQTLGRGEEGRELGIGDAYELVWSAGTDAQRRATASGILEQEAGGPPARLSCDCGREGCYHGLAALWHRALARQGVTMDEWWEGERRRREAIQDRARNAHDERLREHERRRDEIMREAMDRAAGRVEDDARREREEADRLALEARRALYDVAGEDVRPRGRVTFAIRTTTDGRIGVSPRVDGMSFRQPATDRGGYGRRGYSFSDPYEPWHHYEGVTGPAGEVRDLIALLPGEDLDADLEGRLGRALLDIALDANLLTIGQRRCHRAPDVPVRLVWDMDAEGVQTPRLENEPGVMFDVDGPIAIAPDGGVAVLRDDLPRGTMARLRAIGPIPPEDSGIAQEAMATLPEDQRPRRIEVERRTARPRRVVTLDEGGERRAQRATVSAEYDWGAFAPARGDAERRFVEDGRLVIATRDLAAERNIMKCLPTTGAETLVGDDGLTLDFGDGETSSIPFKRGVLPNLEASADWEVRRTDRWRSDLVEWEGDHLDLDLIGGDDDEFLRIEVSADVQGVRSDLLEALIDLASVIPADVDDETLETEIDRIVMPDEHPLRRSGEIGGVVMVPSDILRPVVRSIWRMIHDAAATGDGRTIARLSLADMPDLGSELRLRTTGSIGRLVAMFQQAGERGPTPLPSSFSAEHALDHVQQQGLDWMQALFRAGYGGVLADEVGVGKTIQLLLQPAALKDQGLLRHQALIAVPKTAVSNWEREAARFFPGLDFHVWEGPSRRRGLDGLNRADVVITTYPAVLSDPEIHGRRWTYVGLDEAQDLRNATSRTTQRIMDMKADQKIPASGTPVENSLDDAWTLEQIANPGLLGTQAQFRRQVKDPIEKLSSIDVRRRFSRFLKPFVLRRTRKEAGHGVPDPVWVDHEIGIEGAQARLYEFERLSIATQIRGIMKERGFARGKGEILTALNRLQQVCCHPRLNRKAHARDMEADHLSAKTDAIVAKALQLKAAGKRILVFSRWVEHLALVRDALGDAGIVHGEINGSMSTPRRREAEDAFKAGGIDMLFITLGTGGRSLNLPEADAVFLIDIWWNPQKEIQAVGRTQRRGQTKVVEVHRFLIANSIEIRVRDIQQRKLRISESIYEAADDGTRWEISESDVHDFLRPLEDAYDRAA